LAERHYGKDDQVKKLLINYEEVLQLIENDKKTEPRNKIIGYMMFSVLLLVIFLSVPKQTYRESEIEESENLIGNLKNINEMRFYLKPTQTKIVGSFSQVMDIVPETDTFSIELRPVSGIRPEVYFEIRSKIRFISAEKGTYFDPTTSIYNLNLEILNEKSEPIFETLSLSPYNLVWDYKPLQKPFTIEFFGVVSCTSSAQADALSKKKNSLEKAKYFTLYGDFLNYK
jgi:hypothetical protein